MNKKNSITSGAVLIAAIEYLNISPEIETIFQNILLFGRLWVYIPNFITVGVMKAEMFLYHAPHYLSF